MRQIFFGDGIAPQIFERQIDSAFGVIDAYVLPEVCQLQCGASVVGKLLALGIVIAAEVEDEMSDGIRRIAAVGENVVESFEAGDGLVLAEGDEEIGKFVLRDVELVDSLGQGDENRMARIALVAGVEFGLPFIEQGQGGRGVADFVAQIVGDAAVGVDVEEILAQVFGQKPGGDGKILVVGAGQVAAVFVGFFERGSGCAGSRRRQADGYQPSAAVECGGSVVVESRHSVSCRSHSDNGASEVLPSHS